MTKELKEFLEKLTNDPNFDLEEIVKQAREILREEFKKDVLETFRRGYYGYSDDMKEAILKGDKTEFIHECYYSSTKRDFINNNFGKLDEILSILKEYIESEGEENE